MATVQHFYHEKQQYGLNLNFCGMEVCEKGHVFGPSIRSQFLFHYIIDGFGSYTVGKHTYKLKKGQGFMIIPGDSTVYKADDQNPWTYKWFAFDGHDAPQMVAQCGFGNHNYIYTASDHDRFNEILDAMVNEGAFHSEHYFLQLARLIQLLGIMASDARPVPQETDDYIQHAIEFIGFNYPYDIKITDIARAVGLERSYLYRLFMEETGMAPRDYLIQHRLKSARQMLLNPELSITEVAFSCGFKSSSAFYKHFKAHYDTTPKLYRSQ